MQAHSEACRGADLTARDLLPSHLLAALQARFTSRRVEYIAHVLTVNELSIINDLGDALILARIKRMDDARLRKFDKLIPHAGDHQLYRTLSMQWLRDEEYFLGTRLGRKPTHRELFIDFMHHHHGLRFRAYFSLKYPERVKKCQA
jgi:hypothetical protein